MNSTVVTIVNSEVIEDLFCQIKDKFNVLCFDESKNTCILEALNKYPVFNEIILAFAKDFIKEDHFVGVRMEVGKQFLRHLASDRLGVKSGMYASKIKPIPSYSDEYHRELTTVVDNAFSVIGYDDVDASVMAIYKAFDHPTLLQGFLSSVRAAMMTNALEYGVNSHPLHMHAAGFDNYFPSI